MGIRPTRLMTRREKEEAKLGRKLRGRRINANSVVRIISKKSKTKNPNYQMGALSRSNAKNDNWLLFLDKYEQQWLQSVRDENYVLDFDESDDVLRELKKLLPNADWHKLDKLFSIYEKIDPSENEMRNEISKLATAFLRNMDTPITPAVSDKPGLLTNLLKWANLYPDNPKYKKAVITILGGANPYSTSVNERGKVSFGGAYTFIEGINTVIEDKTHTATEYLKRLGRRFKN